MLWIVTFLAITVLIVVAAMLIPLDIAVRFDTTNDPKFELQVRWFFRVIDFSNHSRVPQPLTRRRRPRPQQNMTHRKGRSGRFVWIFISSEGLFPRFVQFLIHCVRAIEIRDSFVFMKVGFDDPADTGRLTGVVMPFTLLVPNTRFEPDFFGENFLCRAQCVVRLIPIRFVIVLLSFLFSTELRRALRSGLRSAK